MNTEKPSEIPTERLIRYLSDVSQCLQAFVTNSTRAPQVLAGTVRHVDFFDKLYAFLRLLTENGRYHELLEVDADSTCSFLLSVAAFQSAFAREPILGNPVTRSSFLFSAQSFLLTISSVLCHFPLNVDQPMSHISVIIGDGTGKLEVAHVLVEHVLIVSSAFNLSDSVSVPAQFFQWLNRVLVHVTPLWSVENLEHLQLWHQSRQSAAEASSPAVHLTDAFPCMLFSSLLRVSLFLYSRRAVGLSTETIALTISSACDLVAQVLNTIQALRNLPLTRWVLSSLDDAQLVLDCLQLAFLKMHSSFHFSASSVCGVCDCWIVSSHRFSSQMGSLRAHTQVHTVMSHQKQATLPDLAWTSLRRCSSSTMVGLF